MQDFGINTSKEQQISNVLIHWHAYH